MSRAAAIVGVIFITLLNLALVGGSSLFAVGGDGSATGVYVVLIAGSLWVLGFAGRAVQLIARGRHREAVGCVASALPWGLLAGILLQIVVAVVSTSR